MALGNIIREFGVKISMAFEKEKAEKAKKSIEEVGRSLREMGLHAAEAAAAIFEIANMAGEHSRSLEENSKMLGVNVERLQELEYAAKVAAGVNREELVGSLEGLNSTLFKFRTGSPEAVEAFVRLGISSSELADPLMTSDKLLLKVSDRFAGMADGAYKSALANEVGGGALVKLLPLLSKGSDGIAKMGQEARGLGVIMGKDAVEAGANFDREMSKVWFVIKNITFTIGNELIKYLRPIVMEFQKWIVQNKRFIASGIATAIKGLGVYLAIVFKVVKFLVERFKFLVTIMGGLERTTKMIGIAMGIFTAAKLVSGLGTVIKSFQAIAAVFGVIDIEAIAIVAGLAAVILIVQDLFSEDSLIKEWLGMFEKKFPKIAGIVIGVFESIKDAVNDVIDVFSTLFEFVESGFGALKGAFGSISGVFDTIKSFLPGGASGAGAVAAGPGGAAAAGSVSNMSADITVMVPPNMGAKEATNVVSAGVEAGFGALMRNARNANLGGRAY